MMDVMTGGGFDFVLHIHANVRNLAAVEPFFFPLGNKVAYVGQPPHEDGRAFTLLVRRDITNVEALAFGELIQMLASTGGDVAVVSDKRHGRVVIPEGTGLTNVTYTDCIIRKKGAAWP